MPVHPSLAGFHRSGGELRRGRLQGVDGQSLNAGGGGEPRRRPRSQFLEQRQSPVPHRGPKSRCVGVGGIHNGGPTGNGAGVCGGFGGQGQKWAHQQDAAGEGSAAFHRRQAPWPCTTQESHQHRLCLVALGVAGEDQYARSTELAGDLDERVVPGLAGRPLQIATILQCDIITTAHRDGDERQAQGASKRCAAMLIGQRIGHWPEIVANVGDDAPRGEPGDRRSGENEGGGIWAPTAGQDDIAAMVTG